MAEANQQQGGGGGTEVKIEPAAARDFAAQFLPDPKLAASMPEPDVLAYHGKVRTAVDGAVAAALKERGDFSPEWRKAIAGDNTQALETLNRFQTPKALWESYAALRGKVSSGELKAIAPFPANGTDEQKQAWRAEAGIPQTPAEYKIEPPSGVVIGEEDKPFIEGWAQFAHGKNMSNEAVNAGVAWWAEQRQARMEAAAEATKNLKAEVEDKLRTEWGPEYKPSFARIEGLLDQNLPKDSPMREGILESIRRDADFANFMAKIAFQLNPAGSSISAVAGEGAIKTVTDWLEAGQKLMRTDRKAYDKSEYAKPAEYKKYADAYKIQTGKEWGRG